ncbi:MAG: hypothetical protein FWG89_02390 [Treponema sp.]|nr:hypothetical protein [Treponema sp.]
MKLKKQSINTPLAPLPEWLGGMSSLQKPDVISSTIITLSDSIGRLCNLEALGIYSSQNEIPWDYSKYQHPEYDHNEATEKKSPFPGLCRSA